MNRSLCLAMVSLSVVFCSNAFGEVIVFFDSSQIATPVSSGVTSDTISSEGYLFTYTRDKLFTGGLGGGPIGRAERVSWPNGVEAQAVTTPPPGVTDYKARITLERVDGEVFDITAFSAKLLANTAGAGGKFEVVPFLNGEEVFNDPVEFDATGIAGNVFSYNTSPNPLGSTVLLTGFDKYMIGLYVDFALVGLTVESAVVPEPSSFVLAGVGAAGLAFAGWRRKRLQRTTTTCEAVMSE